MFDRKKYKNFAKVQLKSRMGTPILATLLIFAVDFVFQIPSFFNLTQLDEFWYLMSNLDSSTADITELNSLISSTSSSFLSIIQTIVIAIFSVAALNIYLNMAKSPDPVTFSSFLDGLNNWARAITAFLWKYLWIFLWALLTIPLLCIPSIIKMYSYSMLELIIAEHKDITIPRALKISMLITKGHKGELFVLDLSFLGWSLLASLTFGLGYLVLTPYITMTKVNAYHALLQEAIEIGRIRPEDFRG